MPNGYQRSVERIGEQLEHADDYAGVIFAAQSREGITMTMGNQPAIGEAHFDAMLGAQILKIAENIDVHPAVVGHAAISNAIEQSESDDPMITWDHDSPP